MVIFGLYAWGFHELFPQDVENLHRRGLSRRDTQKISRSISTASGSISKCPMDVRFWTENVLFGGRHVQQKGGVYIEVSAAIPA